MLQVQLKQRSSGCSRAGLLCNQLPHLHLITCRAFVGGEAMLTRRVSLAQQVFNVSDNRIIGTPPIWMFADNVPTWAKRGIDVHVSPQSFGTKTKLNRS